MSKLERIEKVVTFEINSVLVLKNMEYRFSKTIAFQLVLVLLFSCQPTDKSVAVDLDSLLYLIHEDVSIIESETVIFERELRDIFSSVDKYHIGENMFLVIDSVSLLTDQLLNKIHSEQELGDNLAVRGLYDEYYRVETQILACIRDYLVQNATQISILDAEIEMFLSNLGEELSLKKEIESKNGIVALKLLEAQVVRNKYNVVTRIGNMYCYRERSHNIRFPSIMNFGEIKPITQNDATSVKIGIQSYEIFNTDDPYKIVILGDTLEFKDQQSYIEYALPTKVKGKNELLVKLLSENKLTGMVYESEVIFEYRVNK